MKGTIQTEILKSVTFNRIRITITLEFSPTFPVSKFFD